MKLIDIDRRLTQKVAEYIANGYTIYSPSMAGHQGEINKVDLVKGKELIRIWLESAHRGYTDRFSMDRVLLRVGVWNHEVNYRRRECTVCFSDISIIEEETFYKLNTNRDWYLDNLDEALECQRVHKSRIRPDIYEKYEDVSDDRHQQIAAKYLKREIGYKRVSTDLIQVLKHRDQSSYKIRYKGHYYILK